MAEDKKEKTFDMLKISQVLRRGRAEAKAPGYSAVAEGIATMETSERASELFMKAAFLLFEQAEKEGRVETVSIEDVRKTLADLKASAQALMK